MALVLVTGPTQEPLTLEEAKLHLRVDHTDDDAYIAMLIITARNMVENHTGRALLTQTWDYTLSDFPRRGFITLPLAPLQSVTSITYYDTAGAGTVYGTSNYQVDAYGAPGRVALGYGLSWPSTTLRTANGVVIRFVAGYASTGAVPQDIKHAMLLIIGHFYENREDTTTASVGNKAIERGVDALLTPYWVKGF